MGDLPAQRVDDREPGAQQLLVAEILRERQRARACCLQHLAQFDGSGFTVQLHCRLY